MIRTLILFFTITSHAVWCQDILVSGLVVDQNDVPLLGVTVQLLPKEAYTSTDESGYFRLSINNVGELRLLFSSIGYQTQLKKMDIEERQSVQVRVVLSEETEALDGVTVTGKTKTQELRESTFDVSVVQTERFLVRNTNTSDIIKQVPGVVVRQTGGFGSNAEVYLNGMTGKSVPFFLDGIPLSYYGSGLGLNVLPASLMDQIEVYKGVVPVHLGADALGGGINIITRKSHGDYLDASYSGGSFNSHKINLNAQWTHPKKQWMIGVNSFFNHSDNNYEVDIEIPDEFGNPNPATAERFHDGFSNFLAGLYGGVLDKPYADRLLLSVRYSGMEDDIQHNAIMAQPYGEVTYDETTVSTSIDYQKRDVFKKTDVKWYGAYNQTRGHFIDTTLNVYTWDGKVFDRRTDGGEISTSRNLLELNSKNLLQRFNVTNAPWEKGKFTLNVFSAWFRRIGEDPIAAQFYGEDFFANPTVLFKNATGLAYEHNFSKKLVSYSAVKHFWLNAEGYAIQNLEFIPNQQEVSNLGFLQSLRYRMTDKFLIKTSYEYATRLPDEFELFGDFTLTRPNPFLEPEQSHNLNLGIQLNATKIDWETNFFYRDTDNIIWLRTSQFFAQYQNLLKAMTLGADMEFRLRPLNFLEITANATYQDLRNRSPKSVTGTVDERYFNARLPNIPYLFGNAEVRFNKKDLFGSGNIFSAWWSGSYVNEFFLFWEVDGNRDFKNSIPSQFVQNIGASIALLENNASLSLECTNLLNEKVFDNFSVQRPGRAFYITLRTFLNRL
ncbi:MAG: TonB-dependent receptor [Maribacter sp.]